MEVGVGGLVFSTGATLLVLPTIYVLMDDMRNWARGCEEGEDSDGMNEMVN
ncbi:hypothetical protein L0337_14195 [candidate division KSB1 bacterium]|nr:hypothetical protein [candidate division KSB1 bacterium]